MARPTAAQPTQAQMWLRQLLGFLLAFLMDLQLFFIFISSFNLSFYNLDMNNYCPLFSNLI